MTSPGSAGTPFRRWIVLGAVFVGLALNVYRVRSGEGANKCAMRLFGFSILYLFLLFAELLSERVVALATGS